MLNFQPLGHVYRWHGRIVPSISAILAPLGYLDQVDPLTLVRRAEEGSQVHEYIHRWLADDDMGEAPSSQSYEGAFQRLVREHSLSPFALEQPLYHASLGYAGRPDYYGLLDDRAVVLEWKTGTVLPATVGIQTAAQYELIRAQPEETLKPLPNLRRFAALLEPDGRYRLVEQTDPHDWSVFISLLNVRRWRERMHSRGDT